MEYKVVTDSYLLDFEKSVNAAMKNGWVPCGGMQIITERLDGRPLFLQAMMRYEVATWVPFYRPDGTIGGIRPPDQSAL